MEFFRCSVRGVAVTAALTGAVGGLGCPAQPSAEHTRAAPQAEGAGVPTSPVAVLPAWGGTVPTPRPELVDAELARDADAPALARGLSSANARPMAVWSRARIGASDAAAQSLSLLDGETAASPSELAALSFLEPPAREPAEDRTWLDLEAALWTRYAVTEDPAAAEALLLAIARLGGDKSQSLLAAEVGNPRPSDESGDPRRHRAVEAIAMLCSRGFGLGPEGLGALVDALERRGTVGAAAAHAIGRCVGPSAERFAGSGRGEVVKRLAPLLVAPDRDTARLAYKAMGALGEMPTTVSDDILATKGPDWIVEVEAVRALTEHADGRRIVVDRLGELGAGAISGPRVHVVREAISGLRKAVGGSPEFLRGLSPLRAALAHGRATTTDPRRAKELALVGCELEFLDTVVTGALQPLERCAIGVEGLPIDYGRVLAVDALLVAGPAVPIDRRAERLLAYARDPSPAVAQAAVSALADLDHDTVSQALRDALGSDDLGVKAAAATSIAARAVDRRRRDPSAAVGLLDVVRTVDNGAGVEARIAAISALGNLARSAVAPDAVTNAAAPPWLREGLVPLGADPAVAVRRAAAEALAGHADLQSRLQSMTPVGDAFGAQVLEAVVAARDAPPQRIRLETDAGDIVIDLRGAPAPIAQAVLASLADAGYYDGLTFHRVVPGFVVQGGDPRGDGYGGPGFVMPCERSSLRYRRGSVGIALAGKDTGGSQFFISQVREPRLDARYTIVGQVTEGLDVVDRILPYDRMRAVKVER